MPHQDFSISDIIVLVKRESIEKSEIIHDTREEALALSYVMRNANIIHWLITESIPATLRIEITEDGDRWRPQWEFLKYHDANEFISRFPEQILGRGQFFELPLSAGGLR